MRTRNAMQLKAYIRNRARAEGVPPQLLMQHYLIERLLERISLSRWRDDVVVKGGMLISSLVGVDRRSTKDLDTTVRGFPLTHENAERAFREIAAVEADDDFSFEFVRTEDIRETDDYQGIRVHLLANYEKMSSPVTVDVTTGDRITPEAIEFRYPLLFDDRTITIMSYPLATTLAEKLETVISRSVANTRPRDYYDLRMLWLTRGDEVDLGVLREALTATAEKRGSLAAMGNYRTVMVQVATDAGMLGHWAAYVRGHPYVGDMTLEETCDTIVEIMEAIGW
ncbi:nucleotidyl transferase AbiEii/AbiGii toxin family protein [Olsenella intestinalis]|uniref:nucleotidyl transferase AbiEii/AbiGii toxin family protein n=1 Tax=Olsenella intestinalis TaxID=2930083 RepID=UPI00200E1AFD